MASLNPPERAASAAKPRFEPHRFPDRSELIAQLARRLAQALESRAAGAASAVMLSGGSTPIPAYQALAARGVVPAPGLALLFSDDRYVPSTSTGSNYHQSLPLIEHLRLPSERVLRVRTELALADAAADYDRSVSKLASEGVSFTLGLLGLGADGHTASLFNATDVTRARGHSAIAVHRPDGRDAVTVTPDVLERFQVLAFVVAGEDKRTALAALLAGDPGLPAWQAVSGRESVEIWTEPQALPSA